MRFLSRTGNVDITVFALIPWMGLQTLIVGFPLGRFLGFIMWYVFQKDGREMLVVGSALMILRIGRKTPTKSPRLLMS